MKQRQTDAETEALRVYQKYWESYLGGDLEAFSSTIDDRLEMIGTSEGEVCHSKADGIAFYKAQMAEVVGKVEMRNRQNTSIWLDPLVLINEACDIYVNTDEGWNFYSKLRLSTLLKETSEGWKIVQQHGSLPDMRVGDGETIAIEKISKENLELRDAINRRTIELEQKNRELEVEAALERVRARTMAMQKSEELGEVATVLFSELNSLVDDLWTCGFVFCEENRPEDEWWLSLANGLIQPFFLPNVGDFTHETLYKGWKNGEAYRTVTLENEMLREHYDWLMEIPIARQIFDEMEGSGIPRPNWQRLHAAYFKTGYLVVITEIPCKEEEIFKRFAQVFDLTYTRFLDLQKAEAQAREAEIQLALERVRARSLAMHHTSELQEVVNIAAQQLHGIGMDIDGGVFICINAEIDEDLTIWASGGMADYVQKVVAPVLDKPIFTQIRDAIRKGNSFLVERFSDNEKLEMFAHLFQFQPWKSLPSERKDELMSRRGGFARSVVISHYTSISITNHHGKAFSEYENEVLIRFGKVFEQSYTRFLDLQKAEAQAREAQIESAMERIRARAMAMHSSSELLEVAQVLREQMGWLHQPDLETSAVLIYHEDQKSWDSWYAFRPTQDFKGVIRNGIATFNKDDCRFTREIARRFQLPEKDYTLALSGAEREEWIVVLMKAAPEIAENALANETVNFDTTYFHFSDFSGGSLLTVTYHSPSEEIKSLQRRAASVFDLAYRRFLDLQKAEAQARESQIQLAMERVRARTMAMQKSSELPEAANLLFQQVQSLGMPAWSAGYCTWDDDEKSYVTLWMSSEGVLQPPFSAPTTEDQLFIQMRVGAEEGKDLHVVDLGGEELEQHYRYMRGLPVVGEILDSIIEAGHPLPTFQIMHQAYFSKGFLLFITYEPVPESHGIFKRFAKVFDQTYTRFLDLQKAEAQAREAEIQLALERVRARALGMHSSNELPEVMSLLFQQYDALGIKPVVANLNIIHLEKNTFTHISTLKGGGTVLQQQEISLDASPVWKTVVEDWKKDKSLTVSKIFYPLDVIPGILEIFHEIRSAMPEAHRPELEDFPEGMFQVSVNCQFGTFGFLHSRDANEEESSILVRFALEFERMYQRFLELQKAEARSREAEIELGVERVRARALAMHQSKEISDLADTLRHELVALKLPVAAATFCLKREDGKIGYWDITSTVESKGGYYFNNDFVLDLDDASPQDWISRIWEPQQKYFVIMQDKADLQRTVAWVRKYSPEYADMAERMLIENNIKQVWHPTVSLEHGRLTLDMGQLPPAETETILVKMGAAFDLAYKRFLDLQKAEAQAREAQIEAALERVRSRTMGMQKSSELNEVAFVLFEQIRLLGGQLWGTGFALCDMPEGEDEFWFANEMGVMPPVSIPNTEDDVHVAMLQGWKKHKDYLSSQKEGEALVAHYRYLYSLPQMKAFFDPMLSAGFEFPTWQQWHAAYFSKGYLLIITTKPYTEPDILRRFAKVFDQTYTRFLDLQKAEAQAREAQIEVAVERVRAKALAMHKSEEIISVNKVLMQELGKLQIPGVISTTIYQKEEDGRIRFWDLTAMEETEDGEPLIMDQYLRLEECPDFLWFQRMFRSKEKYSIVEQDRDELKRSLEWVRQSVNEEVASSMIAFFEETNSWHIWHPRVLLDQGIMNIDLIQSPPAEVETILIKMGAAFDLAHKRFLDLQKAEAQARESQIEAALERVRSRTMAMQRSEELPEVAGLLFQQVKALGVPQFHCGFNIFEIDDKECTWYPGSADGDILPPCKIPLTEHPIFMNFIESRKRGDELCIYEKEGEYQAGHYRYMLSLPVLGEILQNMLDAGIPFPTFQIDHLANFSHGNLLFITSEHFPEMHDTFKRFAKVFEQTYTRFLDLQKAEAQAREAQIEAALEKVRSRTMAMQSSEELADAAYVLFEQLKSLGVTHERINIGIVNEDYQTIDFWITEQGGDKLNTKFSGRISEPTTLSKAYAAWKHGEKSLMIDLQGEKLKSWLSYLSDEIKIPFNKSFLHDRRVQTAGFFSKGMLILTSPEPLQQEALYLLEKFAGVFDLTYTRFSDLKLAEAQALQAEKDLIEIKIARKNAEDALAELKSTQAQLIQQEKLASLGQLTAGIAHEIKNPLNFVNNFSEVSIEMIGEVIDSRLKTQDTRPKTEADEIEDEILEDIKANLEKIHEHGSRANGIVTSMLQHSRGGSGKKEPTDLNALIKEYVNLSFHGMRAGKNPIDVEIALELDDTIKEIPLVREDFTRVIINLCNNAFDAMRQKFNSELKIMNSELYHPKLTVHTKSEKDHILISVEDNGPGIPDEIKDKILQPFFTTKKGTEGTGLGLSITHDIVKAHGGGLEIETAINKGTNFTIRLNR
ncbi:ATP-binding protein [Mariniradius sediminis]|uniref:histidine kinase n=1 Tax=Mariniradius sediminis TaxID=2909237 RepID=A0ABS9BXR0_9BACT|nr:ATP-binding protein [Mariniradius sediminis]MCF1751643.1 ATP-binding protein [Mariniradius sediminis]